MRDAFPNARYSEDFLRDWEKTAESAIEFEQCWVANDSGIGWTFYLFAPPVPKKPVLEEKQTSCPVITMHYNRVPGEERGRGPILNALPAIKTANRVMEYQLKSAAIDLLGICSTTRTRSTRTCSSSSPARSGRAKPAASWAKP